MGPNDSNVCFDCLKIFLDQGSISKCVETSDVIEGGKNAFVALICHLILASSGVQFRKLSVYDKVVMKRGKQPSSAPEILAAHHVLLEPFKSTFSTTSTRTATKNTCPPGKMGDKPQEVGLAGFAGMKPEPIGASQTEYQSTQANYETSQGRYEYSHVKYEQTQIFYQPHSSAQSEQKPLQSSDPSAEKGYTVTGSGTNDQVRFAFTLPVNIF